MQWSEVIYGLPTLTLGDTEHADIHAVTYDSREVRPGTLFVAMRGESTDGNRYVRAALDAGASAVVTDSRESFAFADARHVPAALIEHGRQALAIVSANFYQHPERTLKLTGITGTNGKTTTAFLVEGLLRSAGRNSALLGTIETHVVDEVRPSPHTTPESRDVLAIFADAVTAGATEAVMEMSSHALAQERVFGIPVDVAIFTNLTQDHLDFHGTMDAYAQAKARLFQGVGAPAPRIAVVNADDSYAATMQQAASKSETVWTYGIDAAADFQATGVVLRAGETSFALSTPFGSAEVVSQLTGRVNVYNLLAAIAAAVGRGVKLEDAIEFAATLKPVPGRFETVANTLGFSVVVDYAHTDDALRNLITLARELAGNARVITLFGCGGDRDRTKRPKMGRAAGEGSDVVIITSDNPRSEDPAVIAHEALAGVEASGNKNVRIVLDRAEAITLAVNEAQPGDIVLIAGKGHEKTQTAKGVSLPFDDVAVAAAALRKREAQA
ncbi:UDP-N-acetylmuramoyl-L-alanyl-D-glutamate--2,6-diaminopimelate ligase [Terriglobus roseus]|uniref:UDP-N-acetylmuramoyl-L-alanyl-D-glutamate--2,6-diaminopimelate ligase n=1 Tax=Terriglobus roseus TaxID=392734 RepID=A0A1G7LCV2_9BACT|nr:UDP-N-acetylmuramoyl-L-alanyl-D-glutamate--2,6-diaminopimelate ligase [Terriglobus roseus]SDF47318.1 UDP-N-acetylmuramoylalanyl-D-glutamate--2,6-diaminopimelate ligase [Terriglobus roseus]